MTAATCPREPELADALARGFVPADLAAHAAGCAGCHELHLVASALLDDRAALMPAAPVPGAGTMWWRLQLRQRQAAQATARRSLLVGQGLSLAVALVLLCALFGGAVLGLGRELLAGVPSPLFVIGVAMLLVVVPVGGLLVARQK